jgi:hypothetical protein
LDRLDNLYAQLLPGHLLTVNQSMEFNKLLTLHDAAAKTAEQGCRKLCMGAIAWTPAFTKNRDTRWFWIGIFRKLTASKEATKQDSKQLQWLAKKADVSTPLQDITIDQAINGLKSAYALCLAYSKIAPKERFRFIDLWAQAEAKALNITQEEAIRRRALKEQSRIDGRIYRK